MNLIDDFNCSVVNAAVHWMKEKHRLVCMETVKKIHGNSTIQVTSVPVHQFEVEISTNVQ